MCKIGSTEPQQSGAKPLGRLGSEQLTPAPELDARGAALRQEFSGRTSQRPPNGAVRSLWLLARRYSLDMQSLPQMLQRLVPGLDATRMAHLVAAANTISVAKGEHLLRAGEAWRHLWLVGRGALRLYYLDREGIEANKNFYLEGQVFWPITRPLREEPVSFHVCALEATQVHAWPIAEVDSLMADAPSWVALQLRALQALVEEKMWREQMFLQCDASERYAQLQRARPQWCERLPLRHQASWLGITDVSLSRLRARR